MTSSSLSFQVQAFWVQKSQLFDPVALPSLSQMSIWARHHFKNQDQEVIKGVAWAVEMIACYIQYVLVSLSASALLGMSPGYVSGVSVEADVELWSGFCVSLPPTACSTSFSEHRKCCKQSGV